MFVVPCVTVSLLSGAAYKEQHGRETVVWLSGEHDASTATHLFEAIRRAIDLDGADIMLDFRDVTFMSAATITVIVSAKNLCEARSLSLRLRRLSPCARRLIELCDLDRLVDSNKRVEQGKASGDALRSWVQVPTLKRERGLLTPPPALVAPPAAPASAKLSSLQHQRWSSLVR